MKKILLTIFLILFSFSYAHASEFCAGFEQGYIRGYQQAKNTNNKVEEQVKVDWIIYLEPPKYKRHYVNGICVWSCSDFPQILL